MYDFNADEIFEMAEQIEINGAKFYRDASQKVTDDSSKEFLNKLAAMEDEHHKTFANMRTTLSDIEKSSTAFDPQSEAAAYLKALADTRVFFQKEIDLTSMENILKAAIGAEKDSIVFYLGLKDAVSENVGKNRIRDIIREEMGHIQLLSKKLIALKMKLAATQI
jgi:rubrerythrin